MSKNLKTILIGTTLTAGSEEIARTGALIARAAGATPWLVHAYNLEAFPSELGAFEESWIEKQTTALREAMTRQADSTGLATVPGFGGDQSCLVLGTPYRVILDLARKIRADLIVLGASEGGAIQRAFLGSTADRVIRKAPCPVLVLRPGAEIPPRRVMIPVDFSTVSASAFRFGMTFLKLIGNGKPIETEALFVLNLLEAEGSLQFTPNQIGRFAGDELARFVKENAPADTVSHQVLLGYPREEILREMEERRSELAILGTHGRSGFERMMLGSIASQVLQRAHCNVLVVPPTVTVEEDESAEKKAVAGADWEFVSDESPLPAVRS